MKRVKLIQKKSKNPLFEKWLTEWKTAAEEQGSEAKHTYGKALKSLRKYPLMLKSGKECIILENFGKKTCEMIDKKLEDYKKGFTEDEWKEILNEKNSQSSNVSSTASSSSSSLSSGASSHSSLNTGAGPSDISPVPAAAESARKRQVRKADGNWYLPKYRSGGYALLITLLDHDGATKAELIKEAQKLCDSSFTKKVGPDSFYTAWASMATLLKKKLVEKESKPVRFKLTSEGRTLASKLSSVSEEDLRLFAADTPPLSPKEPTPPTSKAYELLADSPSDARSSCSARLESGFVSQPGSVFGRTASSSSLPSSSTYNYSSSTLQSQPSSSSHFSSNDRATAPQAAAASSAINREPSFDEPHETAFLFPGKFTIILLVDIHETEMQGKKRTDKTLQQLLASNVKAETRHLAVGDFLWIARNENGVELTLPYVVERKRMDDMASSIKDGRFHEQKFRLRGCGLPNVIYLVEKYGNDSTRLGLPLQTLQQAAANSQVVDQFTLKFTHGFDDSIRYLACFTRQLIKIFKDKTLMSCPKENLPEFDIQEDMMSLVTFKQFNKDSVKIKKWTIKEILIKQLIQMKGLSVDKATAIAERYPTPAALISALSSSGGGEKLLADLPCTGLKKIGPVIAKAVFQLYTMADLP